MNVLTKEQQRKLNAKIDRYQTAKRKSDAALLEKDFRHKQVVDLIGKLPILFLQTEEYKKIIREL